MATLTAEQQQIIQSRSLNLNRTVDELLALLTALAYADLAAEKTARRWGCSAGLIGVLGLIASIIWMNVKKHHLERGGTLLAVTVAVTIFCIVMYVKAKKGDLSNNFRTTAFPFLTLLKQDTDPQQKIHVKMDLRDAAVKEKLQSTSDPYTLPGYYRVIDRVYLDPWFSGEAQFVDGTVVNWELVDHVHEQQKTKRNPRGKIKTKTKKKIKTKAEVKMTFASKEYVIDTAGDNVEGKKRSLKLWQKTRMGDSDLPAFQLLVDLIADGYRRTSVAESA